MINMDGVRTPPSRDGTSWTRRFFWFGMMLWLLFGGILSSDTTHVFQTGVGPTAQAAISGIQAIAQPVQPRAKPVALAQTAPTYQSQTSAIASSDTTSLSISLPGGLTDGDLLIAGIAVDGNAGTFSPPAGWQTVDTGTNGSTISLGVFYKIVSGDSASAT